MCRYWHTREVAIQPNTHWNMASLMRSVIQSMNDTASAITFFLCAPVECNASYLGLLKPYLKKGCILTDVGSTKTNIHKKVEELGLEEYFIGGHPMAGSEKTESKMPRLFFWKMLTMF